MTSCNGGLLTTVLLSRVYKVRAAIAIAINERSRSLGKNIEDRPENSAFSLRGIPFAKE
ncbi:MAG: hypothetical protein AAGB13_18305 [Cyanobacteria bacterium P01_F01_bin.33]